MAAMCRHGDALTVAMRKHIEIVRFDAVVEARPQPGEKQFEGAHRALR